MKSLGTIALTCLALTAVAVGQTPPTKTAERGAPVRNLVEPEARRLILGAQEQGLSELEAKMPPLDTALKQSGEPVELVVLAGSEIMDPFRVMAEDLRQIGIVLRVEGTGSSEIERTLAIPALRDHYDVFAPGSSNWIATAAGNGIISAPVPTSYSPAVLAVSRSKASSLGWETSAPTYAEITDAMARGDLVIDTGSASQTNSAYCWLVGMMSTETDGKALTETMVKDPTAFSVTRSFLANVENSSSSTGFLANHVTQMSRLYEGWVNYEYHVVAVNMALTRAGREPFVVVYPKDGMSACDTPIAMRNGISPEKAAAYERLKTYMTGERGRFILAALGRRPVTPTNLATFQSQFNPAQGFNPDIKPNQHPLPSSAVTTAMLDRYAHEWRRPALTVYVVGYGEMMKGERLAQLRSAWGMLFGPEAATRYLDPTANDINVVIPFSSKVWDDKMAVLRGSDSKAKEAFLAQLQALEPSGGSALYAAVRAGVTKAEEINRDQGSKLPAPFNKRGYNVSIVLLTADSASDGIQDMGDAANSKYAVHASYFGRANPEEMYRLVAMCSGRCVPTDRGVTIALTDLASMNR